MDNQTSKLSKRTVQKAPISFHFSTELLEKLEELHFYAQRQIPREKRKRLSKSQLCEICLEYIIADNEINKKNGLLWKIIDRWIGR